MSGGSRPTVFGDDALTYDRARPGYPRAAIEHLLGLVETKRAVEVGAGTGKATVDVARPGLELVCLEPSPAMAEVLEGKRLPGVRVLHTTFEEWTPGDQAFDLVFAAQSWHWVDRASAYGKVKRVTRPGGALALIWNIPRNRYLGFEGVYQRWAPHLLDERDERVIRRDRHDWGADMAGAGLDQVEETAWEWSMEMTGAEFARLCSTYSDHMMLPAEVRTGLLADLEAAVEERGGRVAVDYNTRLWSGLTPVPGRG